MNKIIKTELGNMQQVTLEKMNFLYMEVPNDILNQTKIWPEFEERFPTLTSRKMYGFDFSTDKVYRSCSLILESDCGEKFGLNQFEFEGGDYVRLRLKFNPPELFEKIEPAYNLLIRQYEATINWSRPLVEHYKAKNVLDIMVPIQ